jgi:serine/threonine protein kinase
MPLTSGIKFGPYEIQSPLGAGGMGEVYRAKDTRLDRIVAIKILSTRLSANPEIKQRFEREARAISSLNHPYICHLYDIGSKDGIDFLVMEFLEGETLFDKLRKGPLTLNDVLKIGKEVAEALEVAHRNGIVHRDLKPGNVMLTKGGAKLMDFGLAKPSVAGATPSGSSPVLLSAAQTIDARNPMSPLTTVGSVVGTIQYMSPEQLEGLEVDARSDIFAFGALLYEMTTGKPAFAGKSQITVASAILEKDPELVSTPLIRWRRRRSTTWWQPAWRKTASNASKALTTFSCSCDGLRPLERLRPIRGQTKVRAAGLDGYGPPVANRDDGGYCVLPTCRASLCGGAVLDFATTRYHVRHAGR